MRDCLIIIPTYNEKENIINIIDVVLSLNDRYEILVVDDNSPDQTGDIVAEKSKTANNRLHLLRRAGKQGLGTAYIAGFKWALDRHYEYIFEMDADFSHNPKDLVRLLEAIENGADMSVGSRYHIKGKVENWPVGRILMSYFASVYVRLVTWLPVKDTTAGFVAYSRRVLQNIDLDKIQFVGYAFQIEMKFAAWRLGYKIKEVPITFKDREVGQSKMSAGIFNEAVKGVLIMKWNSLKYPRYYRMKKLPEAKID